MTPQEKKKQLKNKFDKKKKLNKNRKFKSFSELGVDISEETIRWWRANR